MLKSIIDNYLLSCETGQSVIETHINGFPFTLRLIDVLGTVKDMGLIKGYVTVEHMGLTKELYFSVSEQTQHDKVIDTLNMCIVETFLSKGNDLVEH